METYRINIIGLSQKVHHFAYDLGKEFFRKYGSDLVSNGSFHADLELDKRETFIEVKFHIAGTAELTCDRSLELFDYPIDVRRMMVFKYGEEHEEISDEMVVIPRESTSLEVGQYLYEFIGLSIPMKKLHPRFAAEEQESDDLEEGKIVYTSRPEKDDEDTDPRWDQLKKLT